MDYVGTDDPPEPGICYWVFDGPATLDAPAPGNFRVLVAGDYLQAIAAWQENEYAIKVQYPTDEVLDGCQYSIDEHPTGIVQAASIVLPQEGTIHAP